MTIWSLVYQGYDPDQEGLREALCALGNGVFTTRGACPEVEADGTHYPGTYAGGVYNRLTTDVAGRGVENEDLVNLPNWLPLTFRVDGGPWFHIDQVELALMVNPVAGFLLPDHIDEALEVFDVAGNPIGQLFHEPISGGVAWEIAPGRDDPPDAGPLHGLAQSQQLLGLISAAVVTKSPTSCSIRVMSAPAPCRWHR